ncbi:ABC transporter ATP-binding protein [Desulfobacula phenolica]|uniref:Putative ABC transport system ATP-binding protein n=1 Tax=Desulfobacula phenolica TaxID=90732 RepID=A0A1H2IYT0_9BACT|nr:ATP-binding cassette domain-containing protein [Desulfobacula phenolica]SDU49300.1 putative ABC transport system ATP-binding protein [Desulfobacula phenolica]
MIKLEFVYLNRDGNDIFSGLNLSVMKNEKVLIQGKSGAGKTTLFKILLGFEQVDQGVVTINGQTIDKFHIKQIRELIFYLSQDIDLRNDQVCNIIDEIFTRNRKKDLNKKKLESFMEFLELNHMLLEQNVKNLSGGERQRMGLLICFLLDRPVWLLDEPTSALDDNMKKKVVDWILDQNKTIIIVSHDDVWKNNPGVTTVRWM